MIKLIHMFITYLITVFNYPKDNITVTTTEVITNTVTEVVECKYAVLPYDVYKQLERSLSNTTVASNTTDLEAGYKLGIQTALSMVRNGYAIEKS